MRICRRGEKNRLSHASSEIVAIHSQQVKVETIDEIAAPRPFLTITKSGIKPFFQDSMISIKGLFLIITWICLEAFSSSPFPFSLSDTSAPFM